uniref:Protein kinase domain-containing protein n=1 Tax=Oryzias latipes TaxID=8090 RepID=A0A3P9KJP1_ORYLA
MPGPIPATYGRRIMTESSFEVLENIILLGHKGAYFVERFLGEGTFGKVAKCTNLSTNKEVAIKIIKNGFNKTAEDEIKALTEISKLDAHKYSLVKYVEWFHYNSHVCIVFEMLDQSLFDFMKDRSSLPLFLHEIRAIAWQLLISLKGLKSINLVHCDIKLDNIMLVNQVSEPFRVKLIDFGLASKTTDIQTGTRLQNICFRAPEVILGLPLDERLDMWTVGYVLALLYTGFYILPRDSEFNIIRAMVEMQGMPDNEYKLDCWSFDDLKDVYYDQTKIKEVEQLIDLLKRMLEVDPNKRISPNDALRHPFFDLEKKTPKIRCMVLKAQKKSKKSILSPPLSRLFHPGWNRCGVASRGLRPPALLSPCMQTAVDLGHAAPVASATEALTFQRSSSHVRSVLQADSPCFL